MRAEVLATDETFGRMRTDVGVLAGSLNFGREGGRGPPDTLPALIRRRFVARLCISSVPIPGKSRPASR